MYTDILERIKALSLTVSNVPTKLEKTRYMFHCEDKHHRRPRFMMLFSEFKVHKYFPKNQQTPDSCSVTHGYKLMSKFSNTKLRL